MATQHAMSPDLIAFLKAWYDWATSGAPIGDPFDRTYGLCDNAKGLRWALYEELNNLFRAARKAGDVECHIYPFGEKDFDDRSDEATLHECPKRLAWVRERLIEAGESVS